MTRNQIIKELRKRIKRHIIIIALMIFLAFITVMANLYIPILLGRAVDNIIGINNIYWKNLIKILIIILITVLIGAFAQWILNLLTNVLTFRIVEDIRTELFSHLQITPISIIDKNQPGDILSTMVNDVNQLSDGLLMSFTQLFTGILTVFGTIGFMLSINVGISILVIFITPLSILTARFIARSTFSLFQQQSEIRGEMTTVVEEFVGNQKLVRAFVYDSKAIEKFEIVNKKLEKCGVKALFYSALTNPTTRFINGLVYTGVGVLGALLCIKGKISIGQLTSFLSYANQYTKPFNEISGVLAELENAFACGSRIFTFLQEDVIENKKNEKELSRCNGNIKAEMVTFGYEKNIDILKNISFSGVKGNKIALVGPTGCGKTTIMNLIMRFYDANKGYILIDNIKTVDITRKSLRTNIGMVLQDTWLKTGTIKENIGYGKDNATFEEIIEAAKKSHAHSFIKKMPKGYDTMISGEGKNLSEGQKQLLCIARVMLHKPDILILDEATSSIDTLTEKRVQLAFNELMEGRTSIVVAHRLSTILEADEILVLRDGEIIEKGSHKELMKLGGFYKELYESQFADN